MLDSLKRLSLGIALIAVASGILLYSDRRSRNRSQQLPKQAALEKQFRVAFVQHASQAVLEEGARGVIEALAARGYSDGGKLRVRRYNAEAEGLMAVA